MYYLCLKLKKYYMNKYRIEILLLFTRIGIPVAFTATV